MPTARTGACMMEDNIVVRTRRREDSKMPTVMGGNAGIASDKTLALNQ